MDPPPEFGRALFAPLFEVADPMRGHVARLGAVTLDELVGEFVDFFLNRHGWSPRPQENSGRLA